MATDLTHWIVPLGHLTSADIRLAGAKAASLGELMRHNLTVPDGICLTTQAYDAFLDATGLRERIMLELHRKRFTDMRWEEIWDCATRIRHMFLTQPMPADYRRHLRDAFYRRFADTPVAVRSSAPEEDAANASFAGLHASSVNIRGPDTILEHVRIVWASLWSDAALLYRQELGLDVEQSAMAVIIQKFAAGRCSGVAFSQHPLNPEQSLIESVYGLNQGLVDGRIEPDRWEIDRETGRIVSHTPARRHHYVSAEVSDLQNKPLPPYHIESPPLTPDEVASVFSLALRLEAFFSSPQDVEWTLVDDTLTLVQSRPITTATESASDDPRGWYLSLHRSYDNLTVLGRKIEDQWIPAMVRDADNLVRIDLTAISDRKLAEEIERRWNLSQHWTNVYWSDFIPFAHGVRLFGQIYNDKIKPEDPYEFVDLLSNTPMQSIARNRQLEKLAEMVRQDMDLRFQLLAGLPDELPEHPFYQYLKRFIQSYGDLSCGVTGASACQEGLATLLHTIREMSRMPPKTPGKDAHARRRQLQEKFVNLFPPDEKDTALDLIRLARRSYQLRDDDNIHLGRIEAGLIAALQEGRRRVFEAKSPASKEFDRKILREAIERFGRADDSNSEDIPAKISATGHLRPRQLTGQPASPGVAGGTARIIRSAADLTTFKSGEIIVCDAIDPNMTFLIPLAAAVVERRGGMLIHGAIIAREYGLPCITGVADAVDRIRTGDRLSVDGYLGIVTVSQIEADKDIDSD